MSTENRQTKVTIVGAGIAGLTAALRLAERGYKVTLYEQKDLVGGNLGAYKNEKNGIYYDVYPHMFPNWYLNFWELARDVGLSRERDFKPSYSFKYLRKDEFPHFRTIKAVMADLFSGLAPVPDMFLWVYSIVDLLSQRFERKSLLSRQSVNGFICSRPYATNRMAQLHDDFIQTIWAVHSYLSSASAYRDYLKYQVRHSRPQSWTSRENFYETFMIPILKALNRCGCKVKTLSCVHSVHLTDGRVDKITIKDRRADEITISDATQGLREEPVENLILAVPVNYLALLVMGSNVVPTTSRQGETSVRQNERLVDRLPQLSELRRLHGEVIPVLNVYFKKFFPEIPDEYVALLESRFGLTFVRIPTRDSVTALSVAASDFYALPDAIKKKTPALGSGPARIWRSPSSPKLVEQPGDERSDAFTILEELHRYIPIFKLGSSSADETSDIDWDKSEFFPNTDHELYINEVGSEQWRLKPFYHEVPNVFFAGDFCRSNVEIACVEAAVISGLRAAKALQNRVGLGPPITISEPDVSSSNFMALVKLGMAPYAFGAKAWSVAKDLPEMLRASAKVRPAECLPPLIDVLLSPFSLAIELWRSIGSVFKDVAGVSEQSELGTQGYRRRWRVKR